MNVLEQNEMKNIAKGMSEEDKIYILKTISNEIIIQELLRRLNTMTGMLADITAIVNHKKVTEDEVYES